MSVSSGRRRKMSFEDARNHCEVAPPKGHLSVTWLDDNQPQRCSLELFIADSCVHRRFVFRSSSALEETKLHTVHTEALLTLQCLMHFLATVTALLRTEYSGIDKV